jgi:PKD repeat protein
MVKKLIIGFILILLLVTSVQAVEVWKEVGDHWKLTDGTKTVLKWNQSGLTTSWTIPNNVTNVAYLVVAGGGTGGDSLGGGGGAGGVLTSLGTGVTPGEVLEVTVGAGGTGEYQWGDDSVLGGLTAVGGGYGGIDGVEEATDGGSGGGGYGADGAAPGNGTAGQGHDGGYGYGYLADGGAGGGGGSYSTGISGGSANGGSGGAGIESNITGVPTHYGGGGGGMGYGGIGGYGGAGGGGQGESCGGCHDEVSAVNSTGGGGCGSSRIDNNYGGSGVVMVRYTTPVVPVANFTANITSINTGGAVKFNDTSTGSPTSWNWSFGDGTYSELKNITHTYLVAGNFTVNLTATNVNDTDTLSKPDYINVSLSTANFTANVTSILSGQTINFTDTSTGTATGWNWSFGDGKLSTIKNATHKYTQFGLYTVSLNASFSGAYNTSTKTNYITVGNSTPYSQFIANHTVGLNPLPVQFIDQTNASASQWNWSFGDGSYSNAQNPEHTYSGVARYTVILNTTNPADSSNITTKTNYINVTTALANPYSSINITPYDLQIPYGQTGIVQLNVGNINASNVVANISFDPAALKITSVVANTSVLPSMSVSTIYSNDTGFIEMTFASLDVTTETPIANIRIEPLAEVGMTTLGYNNAIDTLTTGDMESIVYHTDGQINTTITSYAFNLSFTNAATGAPITGLVSVNATGSNVTPTYQETSTGLASLTSDYGPVIFSFASNGYYPKTQTITITSSNTINVGLTALGASATTSWYSPHQVRLRILDRETGNYVENATISVTAMANTFPVGASTDYLISIFGVNPASANDMMNGTLIMSGLSQTDGSSTFVMLSSIGYNVNVHRDAVIDPVSLTVLVPEIDQSVQIYPLENDYNIWITSGESQFNTTANSLRNTRLTYEAPNLSYGMFGLQYQDLSGITLWVYFSVTNIDNGTIMYEVYLDPEVDGDGPTSMVYANYTIPVENGADYVWKYQAARGYDIPE